MPHKCKTIESTKKGTKEAVNALVLRLPSKLGSTRLTLPSLYKHAWGLTRVNMNDEAC